MSRVALSREALRERPLQVSLTLSCCSGLISVADHLVSTYDVNVQVNLHQETIATWVEDKALQQICDLFGLDSDDFPSRTLTTGATASNILGLSLGREHALKRIKGPHWSVAEDGFGGVDIDVLSAGAHASMLKAAAVVGIGRSRCFEMTTAQSEGESHPCAFDLARLEDALAASVLEGRGAIVVASIGEVNTVRRNPSVLCLDRAALSLTWA